MMRTFLFAAIVSLSAAAGAVDPLSIKHARVVASDGTFLGVVGDRFQDDSLVNPYGDFGSRLSEKSIWNKFSKYGSEFSDASAFDPYAEHPPKLFLPDHGGWYWLTVNTFKSPRFDPNKLPKPGQ